MARIRSIKPVFWDDSKLSKISRDARLLFIGIWSFADDLGVVIAEPAFLKARIFPYDILTLTEVEKWLSDLLKFGFIVSIEHKGERFFVICNFSKHQRIDKPNHCDVNISKELLIKILQSKNDPRPIPEPSPTNSGSIHGGEDRIGEEGKGEERMGFNTFPISENFNGLPEIKLGAAKQLISITQRVEVSDEDITGMWEAFKGQHLTGKKFYNNEDEVYSHFISWIKDKKFKHKKDGQSATSEIGKTIKFDQP